MKLLESNQAAAPSAEAKSLQPSAAPVDAARLLPETTPVPGGGSWRWNAAATSAADAWLPNQAAKT